MITHHNQSFYESSTEVLASEGPRLGGLIGRELERVWLAVDSDGQWFNDDAVLFEFTGQIQLEIAVYQVGLLALTWNTVDKKMPANWLGCWDYDLKWQVAADDDWVAVFGRVVREIQIVDYDSNLGFGAYAVQFHFDSNSHLVVFNALDELGVGDQPIEGPEFGVHPVIAA